MTLDDNMQNNAGTCKEQTKSRGKNRQSPVRPLFGGLRSTIAFDIVVSPRREHTPTVRIELATPELVKIPLDAKYEAISGNRHRAGPLPATQPQREQLPKRSLVASGRSRTRLPGPCRHQQMAG
jgi:hypothetical protein